MKTRRLLALLLVLVMVIPMVLTSCKPPVTPHVHKYVDGKCECGETDPNYNPGNDDPEEPNKEFGAGAITGIAVGFVAVVGGGGFALFWFVLKKKTWADLLMVFKK